MTHPHHPSPATVRRDAKGTAPIFPDTGTPNTMVPPQGKPSFSRTERVSVSGEIVPRHDASEHLTSTSVDWLDADARRSSPLS